MKLSKFNKVKSSLEGINFKELPKDFLKSIKSKVDKALKEEAKEKEKPEKEGKKDEKPKK